MSVSALPPTAPTTLVVMLGASAWPNSSGFQASEAFLHAAQEFRDYMLDPHGFGLPSPNLLDLFDAATSVSEQLERLGSFLEQQMRALEVTKQVVRDVLVYFVGHGGFAGPSADFYLLNRRANASSLRASGIAIDALAEVLREKARQTRRYLFLDCCFAAAAFRSFQGGPDQAAINKTLDAFQGGPDQTTITRTLDAFHLQARSNGYPSKGTVLFCSSDQKSPSVLLPDESCTMFSRALLDVLRQGDLHWPQQLSLRNVRELVEARLAALPEKNAPRPGLYSPDQSEGDLADVAFFPNPCIEREPDQPEEERVHNVEQQLSSYTATLPIPLQQSVLRQWLVSGGMVALVVIMLVGGRLFFDQNQQLPFTKTAAGMQRQRHSIGVITEYFIPTLDAQVGAITQGPDGNLWFTEDNAAKIGWITPQGHITELSPLTRGSNPAVIVLGPDRNLWVLENGSTKFARITPQGHITEFPLTRGSNLVGLTAGKDDNLWFTEFQTNKIGRMNTTGKITGEFSIPTPNSGDAWITPGSDGNLWFDEQRGNQIGRITPNGHITEFPYPTQPVSNTDNNHNPTAGPDGNLWFTDFWHNTIGRVTPDGHITEYPIPTPNSVPSGITTGPDGNLWFTEQGGNQIGRITPQGRITEYPLPIPNSRPAGITAGPDNNLWFTENLGNKIGKITTGL